jgi:RNA polymerase sigma factor (sigma-70 family)
VKFFRRRCGAADQAEDLAQDVMVRALAHATWKTPEQAKGYVFRSAVNRWRDHRRMTLTHGVRLEWNEFAAAEMAEPFAKNEETGPERVLVVEQELNRVATALRQLNERARDVLLLIRLEQMKHAEVAEMLGISVSTVEKELVKALAHLARRARRDGTP